MENIESILLNKIKSFGNLLIENCHDNEKKCLINNKISNLKFYEILLFINFLQINNLDN
jgi:hypothetical protein